MLCARASITVTRLAHILTCVHLLALAAVAVQGVDPGDALAGAHKSSIQLFAYDDGSMSLVGQLNGIFGDVTVAEKSARCARTCSAWTAEDTILRGTTTRARDAHGDQLSHGL